MITLRPGLCSASAAGVVIALARLAAALDTVETFDIGVSDVEYYGGADAIDEPAVDRSLYADAMLGIGLRQGLSSYLGATIAGNGYVAATEPAIYLGMFGTPLDSDHLDLDLILNSLVDGPGFSLMSVSPMLELNFDQSPEQDTWGLYTRMELALSGRQLDPEDDAGPASARPAFERDISVAAHFGGYVAPAAGHQVLVEYDVGQALATPHARRSLEVGGIALGYNATLNDALEFISQVSCDIPQGSERFSVGAMLGLITTLPVAETGAR